MNIVNTCDKSEFTKVLEQEVKNRLTAKEAKQVNVYLKQFLVGIPMDEFQGRRLSDVYGAMIASWKFLQHLDPDQAKVLAFNPDLEEDGWQSSHSILAILHKNIPFIVDSVRMELNRREVNIHGMQHAVLKIERDESGNLKKLFPQPDEKCSLCNEAIMFVEIDKHTDQNVLNELARAVEGVLKEVKLTVDDFAAMKAKARETKADLADLPEKIATEETLKEANDFIDWLTNENFTFLGYVEYELKKKGKTYESVSVPGSALGVLKSHYQTPKKVLLKDLPERTRKHILSNELFTFAKSPKRARVHRPAYPEYIMAKRFNKKGEVIGERRFLGLYTATVYNQRPEEIPIIRRKTAKVLERSGMGLNDYGGKLLNQLLTNYPRDDLFQINVDKLYDIIMASAYIQERRKIRLFMREDIFGRFVTCMVYVPRDLYNSDLRLKIQDILMKGLGGHDFDFNTFFSESHLARVQYSIQTDPVENRQLDVKGLEEKIINVAMSWNDGLRDALYENYGEEQANKYLNSYQNAFATSYREEFSPRRAAIDIEHIARVKKGKQLSMSFYRALEEEEKILHFKIFHANEPIPLSDVMPIFENMGFRVLGEHPYETIDRDGSVVWLHDFTLTTSSGQAIEIHKIRDMFEDLFEKVWLGDAENDAFNRLIMSAYMNWRQIAMLRSYARYMRQIRVSNSQTFISNTLVAHPLIAHILLSYFEQRFDPEKNTDIAKSAAAAKEIAGQFKVALDSVTNLSEDRVLRLFLDLITATLRTNYYQKNEDGGDKNYIVFKLNPRKIPNVPLPVPMFEIFVYSPRVEGVHLRGGKVARGGLRWSDRYEDYRTEVLGLVKAQQVKNAVIVPVGAKGGFVAKKLPEGDRDAFMAEGIACYQTFVTGLLDVTDNLVAGQVVPPEQVVRYDEDDYYLVVAADKGTATFSDIANEISNKKGHWLGDAFASGGSQGYDHKKMGITAKGAWISVERHFREMGLNVATDPFTVIGIGDMSGDVFGNGMMLSPCAKLVAAFNHLHIFIDPDPDPVAGLKERQRLFKLPRSSWSDYNAKLISKGGGIFDRSAKSIPVSAEMKKVFGITEKAMAPNDLIHKILQAQVDLLWIGGIGTYVKSSDQSNSTVGDKANDAVRINGAELNAKVVGEGGNLGMTQLGRIEYGLKGGRLNTDFIDNAGGVDCSDHEVNIKILLNEVTANGDLTEKQRNKILAEMTDSVAELVLRNNYMQTQAISIAYREGKNRMEEYRRLISHMESAGKLNRALEFIPDDDELGERKAKNIGLTRPELSVLISYVKGDLKETLINSDLANDDHLYGEIDRIFPPQLVKKFGKELHQHQLRREIIATQVANDIVNHMGCTFVDRLRQSTGANISNIALSYIICRDVFRLEYWWNEVEKLDYQIAADVQMQMMGELMSLMRRACRWLLRNSRSELNVAAKMEKFLQGIQKISENLSSYLSGESKKEWQSKYDALIEAGVSAELAENIAGCSHLYAALGIIEANESTRHSLDTVANVYYALGNRLQLNWFEDQINRLTPLTNWQALARETFREDLNWQQRSLTVGLLNLSSGSNDVEQCIDAWVEHHKELVDRWQQMLTEFKATSDPEFSMYSVALRELLDLAQSTEHAGMKASETAS